MLAARTFALSGHSRIRAMPGAAQEIPVLVQLDFQLAQATPVIVCQFAPPIQAFILLHQAISVTEYRLIRLLEGHPKFLSDDCSHRPGARGPWPTGSEPKDKS